MAGRKQRGLSRGWMLGALGAVVLLGGCRQDMQNQPRMFPQRGTTLFADGRSVRPQVEHTVARGQLHVDEYFYTGLIDGKEQDMLPFPVTMTVLRRGQEQFNVFCTPCHSQVGNGAGMIVERGYKPAGNFHDAKRMAEPLSHYFTVMTHGYGAMPNYAEQLTEADRWAVAAYIRALQLSQNAKLADVPAGTKVETLTNIADRQGYPASDAGPWPMPSTAVNALPEPQRVAGAPATHVTPPTAVKGQGATPGSTSGKAPANPRGAHSNDKAQPSPQQKDSR